MPDELCWHQDPGGFVFHYTEPAYAEAISRLERFVVGSGAVYGYGMYATDLAPDTTSGSTLLDVLWGGAAWDILVEGVVVLARDQKLLPLDEVAEHVLLHHTGVPGVEIDLAGIALGYGICDGGTWEFDSSLYV